MVMNPTEEKDMSPLPAGADKPDTSTPAAGASQDDGEHDMQAPGMMSPGGASSGSGSGDASPNSDQSTQIQQALQQHLASLPDADKQFFAVHLTPETVHLIGLVNGPVVEQYLSQFADPNRTSVPVPRKIAEQMAAQYQQQQSAKSQQGQPQPQQAPPAQPQAQAQPPQQAQQQPQGMMSPTAS